MKRLISEPVLLMCGRYQPFHNGHLDLLTSALKHWNGRIVLGLIINNTTDQTHHSPTVALRMGDEAQARERNPLTILERLDMMERVVKDLGCDQRVVVVPVPRPELYWEVIEAMFVGPRTWLLPRPPDEFDKSKIDFFRSKGDDVIQLDEKHLHSGGSVRELWNQSIELLSEVVPLTVFNFLIERSKKRDE